MQRSRACARAAVGLTLLLAAPLLPLPPGHAEDAIGTWSPAGSLSVGRYAPGAFLLPDGRVLIGGGYSFETGKTLASSELFDPGPGKWSDGPGMRFDRNFPGVVPLPAGDSLWLDGFRAREGTTATTEHLEAKALRFTPDGGAGTPSALEERELFSLTRLADGRWLITGGYSTLQKRTLTTAEIFDPAGPRFIPVDGRLHFARFGHTGVLLPDGKVLIVGGKVLATDERVLPAELFDPQRGEFQTTGALQVGRDRCTAWMLGERQVLVAAGSAREGGTVPARRSEIYDIRTGKFEFGPEMVRDRMAHTATPLPDGRVLLSGGWSTSDNATTRQAELWDPTARRFVPAGLQRVGRHDQAAVLLRDGRVLIAGGKQAPAVDGVETPLTAEIWSPR